MVVVLKGRISLMGPFCVTMLGGVPFMLQPVSQLMLVAPHWAREPSVSVSQSDTSLMTMVLLVPSVMLVRRILLLGNKTPPPLTLPAGTSFEPLATKTCTLV